MRVKTRKGMRKGRIAVNEDLEYPGGLDTAITYRDMASLTAGTWPGPGGPHASGAWAVVRREKHRVESSPH